ncbi:group 3 secretory phospholipase A2-like [Lycodopsis pacificus]
MQSSCMLQVVFVLSSLILSKAQHVIGSGHSCLRSSPAEHGQTRITFLREDAAGVRSLYVSLWSEDTQPVICEVNTNPIVMDRYCSICDKSGTQDQEITQRFNISKLLSPDSPCALVSSSVPKFAKRTRSDGTGGKVRRKRAWIFPGTLWCGTGSKAAGYEQLGMFESADRCCREHDHCLHVILSFTVNYGVFNSNLFSVSHCDCDQRFRQCLLGVNDTISSMVGYSFFNILQVPCFRLKQQMRCTEMYWWGMCKVAKKAPYAVFQNPLPYADVTSKNGDNTDSNMQKATSSVTTVTPSTNTNGIPIQVATDRTQRLTQTTATPKQDTLKRLWSTATSATAVITKPEIATSIHEEGKPQKPMDSPLQQNNTRQEAMGSTIAQSTHAGRRLKHNIALDNVTDNQLLCGSLKHLDGCKYNILPLEKKYDLQNVESKTAYHCDCTSRLAVLIESFKQPNVLPKLLMDFVSQYCFKLPNERKCHRRKSCAGFSKASDLLQALSMMEEKDTAGVQNAGNDRRRGIPTRLYKRCLRLVREADVVAQLK